MRLIFAALMAVFLWSPAQAQTICIDRTDMLDRLADEFDEHLSEVRDDDDGLMEILTSPTKGTWTMILTQPNGFSCIIATGEGLMIVPATKEYVAL